VLQQALQQRCDAASDRVVATLKQASWQRCGAVASSQQRRRATRWRGGQCSRQRQAALRYSVFFFFFLLDSFKERTKARQREKRQGFETCFPALLVGLNVTRKLSLAAIVVATCAPSGNNNTTPVVTTQELQKCKKFVAFNMKQQEIEFF
jgi:hypothetical protein